MPKRKTELSQAEQSERFRKAAQDLLNAGELSPAEAEERFEKTMEKIRRQRPSPEPDE